MELGSRLNEQVDNPFYGIVNNGILANPRVSRAQLLRPYPQFTDIIPAVLQRLLVHLPCACRSASASASRSGLQFEGSYTKAKAIDNAMSHQDSYNILQSRSSRRLRYRAALRRWLSL